MKRNTKIAKRRSAAKRPIRSSRRSRPLHKRLALHPVSVLFLLCVGVLLGGITFRSFAASYTVTGKVPAAPLTEPATITSPADQTHFSKIPITVKGACPENSYVKLIRNGTFSGSAICGTGQTTYEIVTDLAIGSNTLQAQDYNITDDAGPSSSPITVYYEPPAPAESSTSGSSSSGTGSSGPGSLQQPATRQLFVPTDFSYQPVYSGKPFVLNLSLIGGIAPYAVTINWGDGKQSTLVRTDNSKFTAEHVYKVMSDRQQVYLIKIWAVDKAGNTAYMQVAEIVRGAYWQPGAPVRSDTHGGPSAISTIKQWLWLIWPAYGVTMLMVLSFWLGERQELSILRHRHSRPRRA